MLASSVNAGESAEEDKSNIVNSLPLTRTADQNDHIYVEFKQHDPYHRSVELLSFDSLER